MGSASGEPAAPKTNRLPSTISLEKTPQPESRTDTRLPFCPSLDKLLGQEEAAAIQNSMQFILNGLRDRDLLNYNSILEILDDHHELTDGNAIGNVTYQLHSFYSEYEKMPFEPIQVVMSSHDGFLWMGRFMNVLSGLEEAQMLTYEDTLAFRPHFQALNDYYDYMGRMTQQPECTPIAMAKGHTL